MRLIKMLLILLPSMLISNTSENGISVNNVLVCYGRLNPEDIKGYSYVILESQYYNIYEINKIKAQNEKVVAYISLGEVNAHAPYFKRFENCTFGKNEIWNSHYLNLKAEKTTETIMDIISNILTLGYDGFFFDNIDNFTSFGPQPNQKKELIQLLKTINDTYPNHIFLQNAGLEIIDETAPYVDAVIMESVATDYTFDEKGYKLRNKNDFDEYVSKLKHIKKKHKLPIILIEYADTMKLRDDVQKRIKSLHFDYFIGNIDLQRLPQFSK